MLRFVIDIHGTVYTIVFHAVRQITRKHAIILRHMDMFMHAAIPQ